MSAATQTLIVKHCLLSILRAVSPHRSLSTSPRGLCIQTYKLSVSDIFLFYFPCLVQPKKEVSHASWVMWCGSCGMVFTVWVMRCGSCCVGITRHMRVHEARARCPQLVLMHVEVIGAEGREALQLAAAPRQQDANGGSATQPNTPAGQPGGPRGSSGLASRQTHKACLERYRVASASIMGLLRKMSPGVRDPATISVPSVKPPFLLAVCHRLTQTYLQCAASESTLIPLPFPLEERVC